MPKFLTYQRPAAVNKQNWGGKPGTAYGKHHAPFERPGKKAPKPNGGPRNPVLDIKIEGLLSP